jgi:uncharacterized membrane protein HdeD (DUF308 family)
MAKLSVMNLTAGTDWLLLRNIICVAAGVLLWIYPDAFATGVVIGIGIFFILYGVIAFLLSLLSLRKIISNMVLHTTTINSIVSLAVGLAFVIAPSFFAQWFITVIGVVVIGLALLQLIELSSLRKFNDSVSALFYLSPLVLLTVGILVIVKPAGIIHLAGYFCAGALIYTGVSGIVLATGLYKARKRSVSLQKAVTDTPENNPSTH